MDAKFIRHYATLSLVMSVRGMNPTATFTASLCEGNPVSGKKVRCARECRAIDKVILPSPDPGKVGTSRCDVPTREAGGTDSDDARAFRPDVPPLDAAGTMTLSTALPVSAREC